jgi:hypothetical protein
MISSAMLRCFIVRTTLRIDDDLLAELKRRARAQRLSLTELTNRVLRLALRGGAPGPRRRYREKTASMGRPAMNLDKALAHAAALEDRAVADKLALRK